MKNTVKKEPVYLLLLPLPPPFAGPETVARGLVDSLAELGTITYKLVNSTLQKTNKSKGKLSISGLAVFFRVLHKYISSLQNTDLVYMYLCSSKVGFIRDSVYIFTARIFHKKIVAQYHGGNFHSFYDRQSFLYKAFIRFTLLKLQRLFVLGNSLRKMFTGILPNDRVSILYNGIDTSLFPMKTVSARKEFTIFFMGHLTFPKGFYDLVIAYKILYKKYGSHIRLVFAGERVGYKLELKQFLNKQWSEYYVANIEHINAVIEDFIDSCSNYNASYLGIIDAQQRITALHNASLFVLPSHTEGMSMSCIEAMSVGLPVVVTAVGAMSEIVIDTKGGLITETGDPETLASCMEKIFLNSDLAQKMGDYNSKFVANHLNITDITAQLHHQLVSLIIDD